MPNPSHTAERFQSWLLAIVLVGFGFLPVPFFWNSHDFWMLGAFVGLFLLLGIALQRTCLKYNPPPAPPRPSPDETAPQETSNEGIAQDSSNGEIILDDFELEDDFEFEIEEASFLGEDFPASPLETATSQESFSTEEPASSKKESEAIETPQEASIDEEKANPTRQGPLAGALTGASAHIRSGMGFGLILLATIYFLPIPYQKTPRFYGYVLLGVLHFFLLVGAVGGAFAGARSYRKFPQQSIQTFAFLGLVLGASTCYGISFLRIFLSNLHLAFLFLTSACIGASLGGLRDSF